MATALDLIARSMRRIGVLASGETASSSEAQDALTNLSAMFGSWSTEGLLIYGKVSETFPFVVGTQSYTMGTGGTFNTTRPLKVESALLETTQGTDTFDLPIEIVNQQQWDAITIKTNQSSQPNKLLILDTYPLATLYFWPIPNATASVVLRSWKPLTSIASISTTVDLPPGYEDAIVLSLARRLAPEYGKAVDELLNEEANFAKANIKRMNIKTILMSVDPALKSRGKTYNIYTGDFRR